jgi:glucose/arabinose dehydrogenase
MEFAPDGRLFFTERRSGRLSYVEVKAVEPPPTAKLFATLPSSDSGEGGLLGLALSPEFASDRYVYVYYTDTGPSGLRNRVVRLRERNGTGAEPETILDGIPGASVHDGGRIRFGPDGKLYVTAGDAGQRANAQDLQSLAGKILRLNPDGSIPSDNPFPNSPVYSYGHRNPQGIDWHPRTGRMYETEHGPSGEASAFAHDEVNWIQSGKNYGWPAVVGTSTDTRYVNPIYQTGDTTWAPSGCSFCYGNMFPAWRNSLFVTTLRGVHLHRFEFDEITGQVETHEAFLQNMYGRLRDVIEGPDGFLYLFTSNRDGRGSPASDDDKLLRIRPI